MAVSTKFIKSVAGYSAVLLLSKGLTLLSSYLLALNVSDRSFGFISLAQAGFATALALLGINASSGYIRYHYTTGFRSVLTALRIPYIILIALSLISTAIIYLYFRDKGEEVWFAILPLTGIVASWLVSSGAIFRCAGKLIGYALCEAGRPLLVFITVVVYVAFDLRVSAFPYYVVAFFGAVLFIFIIVTRLLSKLPDQPHGHLQPIDLIGYLLPLVFVQITSLLNNVGDRYFLAAFVSVDEIGLYGKAYLLGSSLGMLFDSISILWAPYVMKHKEIYLVKLHGRVKKIFFGSVGLSVLAITAAILATEFVYQDMRIRKLVIITLIVTGAFLARIGYQVLVPVLCAYDETKAVARVAIFGAGIGVLANCIFIPWIGVYGAAIATLVALASTSAGSFIVIQRRFKSVSNRLAHDLR